MSDSRLLSKYWLVTYVNKFPYLVKSFIQVISNYVNKDLYLVNIFVQVIRIVRHTYSRQSDIIGSV